MTLFGQSAGGYLVLHHIANVRELLFRKAIIASAFVKTSRGQMKRNTQQLYETLGKNPKECTTSELLEVQAEVARRGIGGMQGVSE